MDHLKVLEVALHQYDVRADIDILTELLHPKYIEIGFSGRTYDFRSIIDSLLSESSSGFEVWSQDYEYIEYAPNIVQIIYRSARLNKDGALTNHAKRTSIWVKESESWKMRFHQATPIGIFEKLNV